MRKNILVTAGGTATAWHITKTIKSKLSNFFNVFVSDCNEEKLIPSSKNADYFLRVPPINTHGYYEYMLKLIKDYNIDVIIPLIDMDLFYFYEDNYDLKKMNVVSTGPTKKTLDILSNKKEINKFCEKIGIKVPKEFNYEDLKPNEEYFVKPLKGYGSKNAKKLLGKEILVNYDNINDFLIQEICEEPEITVEIFYKSSNNFSYIIRERVETKAGVCTKARFFDDRDVELIIERIVQNISLPRASCIQFMKKRGEWLLTDLNLRLGAGTALSSAIGWDLTYALLVDVLNVEDPFIYLKKPKEVKNVVRVYQEIVMD